MAKRERERKRMLKGTETMREIDMIVEAKREREYYRELRQQERRI